MTKETLAKLMCQFDAKRELTQELKGEISEALIQAFKLGMERALEMLKESREEVKSAGT